MGSSCNTRTRSVNLREIKKTPAKVCNEAKFKSKVPHSVVVKTTDMPSGTLDSILGGYQTFNQAVICNYPPFRGGESKAATERRKAPPSNAGLTEKWRA